jgi:DNA-3-methyladenine glycosylase I
MELQKCGWAKKPLDLEYHDKEGGVPVHDDKKLFEFLVLDAFQAGLSWSTILNKRENFRKAFDSFDYQKIAKYDQNKIGKLILDAGIIRNKLKINATIGNAKAFMEVQKEFGSFDQYIWSFTGGKTKINTRKQLIDIPSTSSESDAMSKDLKKRGFKFVGSTICYAFMQAVGMVNDHLISCFRYKEVGNDK